MNAIIIIIIIFSMASIVSIWASKEIKKIVCRRTLIKFSYTIIVSVCVCVFVLCGIKRRFKGHSIYNVRFAGVSIFERLRAIFCKNTLDLWGCNLFMCAHTHHPLIIAPIFTCPIWCYCWCYWCWCCWYCFCFVALGFLLFFYSFSASLSCTENHQAHIHVWYSIATVFDGLTSRCPSINLSLKWLNIISQHGHSASFERIDKRNIYTHMHAV